ncbi:alpha/beta hydrolase [Rhodococcus sp. D2-41]|nr:alpha/beta hydrolase [Rhodococcus sp. D2-41]
MGRGRTWDAHLPWLRGYGHVYTLDAAWHRGRDVAEQPTAAGVSTERFVDDAARAIRAIGDGPAVVIGHSMGGLHGWCLAAAHPDLVSALVVEDMAPDFKGRTTGPWDSWFDSWPVEFADADAALGMFGDVAGRYFLDSFDRTDTGWRLHGHIRVWRDIANHWGTRDYWAQWHAVRVPTLLIEAEYSITPEGQMRQMAQTPRDSGTTYLRVAGAGHLVQADAPQAYRQAVEDFLSGPAQLSPGSANRP